METYSTDFLQNMKTMARWFRKRDFTEDQLELWYERIGMIPSPILRQLVNQVIDNNKFMPTPAEIKNLYGEYRKRNPREFISSTQGYESCEYCDGKGRIIAWKVTNTFNYEYDIACGHCENWRRVFPTRPSGPPANIVPPRPMKIDEILSAGFVLDNPDDDTLPGGGQYDSINDMAESVGSMEGVPF